MTAPHDSQVPAVAIPPTRKVLATCSICEACCGCEMEVAGSEIKAVRADRGDPLSRGFICIKGLSIPKMESDPERLRLPMVRENGRLRTASWEEAYEAVERLLAPIVATKDPRAVAFYLGNSTSHNFEIWNYLPALQRSIRTPNVFTAQSQDNSPRLAASALLYGECVTVPVPDLERCELLWIMGANPAASNGSMATSTGWVNHLQRLKERGGKVITFDPRRTPTAKMSDEYFALQPTSDAAFLAAVAHELLQAGPEPSSGALLHAQGVEALGTMLEPFTPESVAQACGIAADDIRRLARELRDCPRAAVYGRIGTNTQRFGTLAAWLMDVVNILAGNLDVEGGSMFPMPLAAQPNTLGTPGRGKGTRFGRWKSRVRGVPEFYYELPTSCMAEEILTPGEGQVRALISIAGNPGSSVVDHDAMQRALSSVEVLISLDNYVNETSMHADVILPSPPRLARSQYDMYYYQNVTRIYARFTPAYRPLSDNERSDRETILRLASVLAGGSVHADVDALDARQLRDAIAAEVGRENSSVANLSVDEMFAALQGSRWEERLLDLQLRLGPFGDHFGQREGIRLEKLREHPHGMDLGLLVKRLPEVLRTPSGKIELMCDPIQKELGALAAWLSKPLPEFVLVGRRQIGSFNSWWNHLPRGARPRSNECRLQMNPADGARLGLAEGDTAICSRAGHSVSVEVSITPDIRPGVVSLPHGWGHQIIPGEARAPLLHPGANVNVLTNGLDADAITGCAQLNGYEVQISRAQPSGAGPVPG